jgi:predicted dehydrogenase
MKKRIITIFKILAKQIGILRIQRDEYALLKKIRLTQKIKLSKTNINCWQLGCGVMGKQIISAIHQIPNAKVLGVFDINQSNALYIKQNFNNEVQIFSDLDNFFKNANSDDILVIATPANSHIEFLNIALDKGFRKIFIEKPIGTCLTEVLEINKKVNLLNAIVYVDHTRRWMPIIHSVRKIIQSGRLGLPVSFYYLFGRAGLAMIGTHIFDIIPFFFNSPIVKVKAKIDKIERTNWRGSHFKDYPGRAELMLNNGIFGTVDLSDNLLLQQDTLMIFFENGRIEIDQRNELIRIIGGSGKVWEESYPWKSTIEIALMKSLTDLSKGKEPICSVMDGLNALEICIACYESERNNRNWVDLPLESEIVKEKFPFA